MTLAIGCAAFLLGAVWLAGKQLVEKQPVDSNSIQDTFSPAHSSVSQAVLHFFGFRPAPIQPIAFDHKAHIESVELECIDCHVAVALGPRASIPDIRTCWSCHSTTLTDHPEIKKLKEYRDQGQDVPWQRVWGWFEEAHVHFNHAPHIRAAVDCATCHGDVGQMTVATRPFEHTMGFCVDCHQQRQASVDCVTCHY